MSVSFWERKPVSSVLAHLDWKYVEKPELEEFTAEDWAVLDRQRGPYYAEEQARQALRLLTESRDDKSFGYQINNYDHCLQSATMVMRAGRDEEDIVVALFHDVGFITCPDMHGEFAAALMGAYISERNYWMLRRHAIFQQIHCGTHPNIEPNARDQWTGHPHYSWTAEFVAKFDQNAIQPDYDNAPLDAFVPMVHRLFAKPPRRPVPLD